MAAVNEGGMAMKDLTDSSIARNIVQMAMPIAAGMFFQTLYFLIDLYFVAGLGDAALAGVSAAGNVMFIVFAATQVLGVGTVTLISHAAGRKDQADATLVFNQSLALAASLTVIALLLGFFAGPYYVSTLGASPATVAAGIQYLHWFLPSLALQFAMVVMGSALRGTGIVQPTMLVQVVTVILNAILAPVLIAGWGTHHPMGVAGGGLVGLVLGGWRGRALRVRCRSARAWCCWPCTFIAWRNTLHSTRTRGARISPPGAGCCALACLRAASSRSCSYIWPSSIGSFAASVRTRRRDSESALGSCRACFCRPWRWPLPR